MIRTDGSGPPLTARAGLHLVLALLGLFACATPMVRPGIQPIGDTYTVETPIQWRRHDETDKMQIWTSRGPTEDQLVFVTGLAPGEALIPALEPFPRYQAGMTPQAIAQFVVNSYVLRAGPTDAAVHRVWPARFGSLEGFRFEYGYTTTVGIDVHAFGAGAVKDSRLYLIYLEAAGQSLFDKLRPIAERIIDSATL